jgi:hypothetical protein
VLLVGARGKDADGRDNDHQLQNEGPLKALYLMFKH